MMLSNILFYTAMSIFVGLVIAFYYLLNEMDKNDKDIFDRETKSKKRWVTAIVLVGAFFYISSTEVRIILIAILIIHSLVDTYVLHKRLEKAGLKPICLRKLKATSGMSDVGLVLLLVSYMVR